jgi:hypothetical protein
MSTSDQSFLLRAGLASGACQIAAGVAMYVAGVYFQSWSMSVSLFVLILCLMIGIRGHASRGPTSFGRAVLAGVVISVSTGLLYAVYNLVTITWLYPGFLDQMARAQLEARGGDGSLEAIRGGLTPPLVAIGNLVRLSVFGSALSLAIAFMVTRTRAAEGRVQPA